MPLTHPLHGGRWAAKNYAAKLKVRYALSTNGRGLLPRDNRPQRRRLKANGQSIAGKPNRDGQAGGDTTLRFRTPPVLSVPQMRRPQVSAIFSINSCSFLVVLVF